VGSLLSRPAAGSSSRITSPGGLTRFNAGLLRCAGFFIASAYRCRPGFSFAGLSIAAGGIDWKAIKQTLENYCQSNFYR
jgi:hypothetical protein